MKLRLTILFALIALISHAQRLEMLGGGAMGDNKFQVVYMLSGVNNPGKFSPAKVEGAKVIYVSSPQSAGGSHVTEIVNGKVVQNSSSQNYRYTVTYKAEKTGNFRVGPATCQVGGRTLRSSGGQVQVRQAASSGPSAAQVVAGMSGGPVNLNNPFSQTATKPISDKDLYVRIEMSRPKVYEQEAVVCTIKLYTKFPIRPEIIPLKQPSFTGFLIEEIKQQGQVNIENVGGQNYYTAVLKKCILYPQQSGRLTINSGVFDITPVQRDIYVGLNSAIAVPHDTKLTIKSNSSTVTILPLPNPKPVGYTGAVGHFKVTQTVTPAQLRTYAPATLTYQVSGVGNIKYIKAPVITFPKEFDTYDPQTKINTGAAGGDVSGTVTFTYQFIPQYVGTFKIPEGKFTYFNPETDKYETITIPAQELKVEKGAGKPSSHYKAQQDRQTDILPLQQGDLGLSHDRHFVVSSWPFWLCFAVPLLLFIALLIYYRNLLKERADERRMRNKRAGKVAAKRLKQARRFVAAGDANAFYAEVLRAMWGYLSDKLSIPVSDLSKDNIDAELEKYGVGAPLRERTLQLLDKCEFAQYAPQLADSNLASVMQEAATLMDDLESVKRKKIAET